MSMQPYISATLEVLQHEFPKLTTPSTPFEGSIDETSTALPYAQQKIYRSAVGAIGWMTSVRIDLDFAFSRLSQHLQNPTTSAWNMLHRTMGYIKSHQHLCLSQSNTSEPEWKFFTDSDHGSDKTNLKPQLGILATCGGTPIIFKSKKSKVCFPHSKVQTAHSDISVGASEVYALGSGTSDFMGLSYVVEKLGLPKISLPMNIRVDNTAKLCERDSQTDEDDTYRSKT